MRRHGLSFDHNLHALRIVEDFELRYAAFRGLNLTFEVREGIIKHSHDYDPAKIIQNSPSICSTSVRRSKRNSSTSTDEIAYSTADLDDGYEARLLAARGHSIERPDL